jgi:hypothetical protein
MKSQTLKAQKQLSLAKKFKYATTLSQFPPSLGMSDTLQQKTILQAKTLRKKSSNFISLKTFVKYLVTNCWLIQDGGCPFNRFSLLKP